VVTNADPDSSATDSHHQTEFLSEHAHKPGFDDMPVGQGDCRATKLVPSDNRGATRRRRWNCSARTR